MIIIDRLLMITKTAIITLILIDIIIYHCIFLVSEVLTWMVVKLFKITSPKVACILFQALTALIVIGFFWYQLILREGWNNLTVEEPAVLQLCISEQSENQLPKINDNILWNFYYQEYLFKLNFIFKFK